MIVATSHSSPTIDQETKSWLPCVVCFLLPNFLLQTRFLKSTSRKWTKLWYHFYWNKHERVRENCGIVLLLN